MDAGLLPPDRDSGGKVPTIGRSGPRNRLRITAHAAVSDYWAPESPLEMTRPPSPLLFGM